MRPIHKFILHVVHNWTNELNEAYSEKAIKMFADHFGLNLTKENIVNIQELKNE